MDDGRQAAGQANCPPGACSSSSSYYDCNSPTCFLWHAHACESGTNSCFLHKGTLVVTLLHSCWLAVHCLSAGAVARMGALPGCRLPETHH